MTVLLISLIALQGSYEKLLAEVPKYKMITPSVLADRLRVSPHSPALVQSVKQYFGHESIQSPPKCTYGSLLLLTVTEFCFAAYRSTEAWLVPQSRTWSRRASSVWWPSPHTRRSTLVPQTRTQLEQVLHRVGCECKPVSRQRNHVLSTHF